MISRSSNAHILAYQLIDEAGTVQTANVFFDFQRLPENDNKVIAKGELVETEDGSLGVKITEIPEQSYDDLG